MTNPTKELSQSIRERLARSAQESLTRGAFLDMEEWQIATDAILAKLAEPSKEMIEVGNTVTEDAGDIWEPSEGISYGGPSCGLECWKAMLQYIQDGGK